VTESAKVQDSGRILNANFVALIMVLLRRKEDRIRELCARVTSTTGDELRTVIAELRLVISEYTLQISNRTSAMLLAWPKRQEERRKKPGSGTPS
jgi:hypothetical protein